MTRKSGVFGGIIALLMAFIQMIPIFPPMNLEIDFYIFTLDNVKYYFWGHIDSYSQSFSFLGLQFPENLVSICTWFAIFFIGLSSIMASTTKANLQNSVKLYRINILFTILLLIIFGFMVILSILDTISSILIVLGVGYYSLIFVLIMNITALHFLKKK